MQSNRVALTRPLNEEFVVVCFPSSFSIMAFDEPLCCIVLTEEYVNVSGRKTLEFVRIYTK